MARRNGHNPLDGHGGQLKRQYPALILIALLCLFTIGSHPTPAVAQAGNIYDIRTWFLAPSDHAKKLWQQVLDSAEYKEKDIVFRKCHHVPNAMAYYFPPEGYWWNGRWVETKKAEKYVVYNPNFMAQLDLYTNSDKSFPALGIFAHELGHHKLKHFEQSPKTPHQKELEADEFSGAIMKKMGASETDIEATFRLMYSAWATPTHPASDARIAAICKGYHGDKAEDALYKRLIEVHKKFNEQMMRWH
ncbi:MAG: hypothetical protein KF696_06730 [Planctomycetes bacterium]|nr:hypothetical protein [Planctomycetota bacterium]MCW8137180.1 hypothetical protein [Planctomycetota bacterium]